MTTRLILECGGCFAKAEGTGPLRREFRSFSGRSHGFGTYCIRPVEELTPPGWIMFDPWTGCTYCPTCWAEIRREVDPDGADEGDGWEP